VDADPLGFLQNWYSSHCDGDWEHDWGASITTLDNPGWFVRINLVGTRLEGPVVERVVHEWSDSSWLQWWSDGNAFEAACGAMDLHRALKAFVEFVKARDA
jgi:Immunity protein 53